MLQYHVSDTDVYATSETRARAAEYGVTGIPTMAFDGSQNFVIGSSGVYTSYLAYKAIVDTEWAEGSNLTLVAYRTIVTTEATMHFSATVTNHGATALTNVYLRFVVYEDLGSEKRYLVRDMLPPQTIASLLPGASVTLAGDSDPLTGVNLTNAGGVAFVQDPTPPNREVLQAALAVLPPPTLQVEPTALQFQMHPDGPDTSSEAVRVRNGGGGSFTWTAADDAAWLTVDPLSGPVPGSTTVTANKTGLTPGEWYTGHVTVTASAGTYNSPQVVGVSLHILLPGPPAHINGWSDQTAIRADGVSTTTVHALVTDAAGIAVSNGTAVSFQTDLGTVVPATATTTGGAVQATLVSTTAAGMANVVAQAGTVTGTIGVRFVGPPHSVSASANPLVIRANGVSTSAITVHVTDAADWPVFDGTVVTYTIDLGSVTPAAAITVNGNAYATVKSSAAPGQALVTAQSGGITGTVVVTFGGPPNAVNVAVAPGLLPADGTSTAVVTATVSDQWGDRVVDGTTVVFSTTLGLVGPVSGTTVGGVATTTLTAEPTAGRAVVTAIAGGKQGQGSVLFYSSQLFLPLVTRSL